MRPFPVVLATALLLGSTEDCATLPTLGICGNALVDLPNEDCDGQAGLPPNQPNVHCGAPNTPNACRFTCSGKGSVCPEGYFCSVTDGICRKPDGTFSAKAVSPVPFAADFAALGDYDGDGIDDLFASHGVTGTIQSTVYFFGAGGAVASETSLPPVLFGAGGPLTSTSASDVVGFLENAVGTGMLVMQGNAARSLLPASFSSFPFAGQDATFLPLFSVANQEILALKTTNKGPEVVGYGLNYEQWTSLISLKAAPALKWGRAAFLGEGKTGGNRLGLANTNTVDVYGVAMNRGGIASTVSLPDANATIEDFWFTHFDPDPYMDLVVSGRGKSGSHLVFVAYGTKNGDTFAVAPGGTGSSKPTAVNVDYVDQGYGTILGVENLVGRPTGEVICQQGIATKGPMGWTGLTGFDNSASEVVTADFNRDGRVDLMFAVQGASEVEYLLNAGEGRFNEALVSVSGAVSKLVVGDYDGDLYPDVAFAEAPDSSTGKVGFLFGGMSAQPAGPVEVGPFLPIEQVTASPDILNTGVSTSRTDLLAVTGKGDKAHVALFPGSANRQMYSPWFFVPGGASFPVNPTAAAVGVFSGGSNGLAILTDLSGGVFMQNPLATGLSFLESGKSTLTQPANEPTKLPKIAIPYSSALVTIPGGSGVPDRVAVVGPANSNGNHGIIAVAGVSGGAFAFDDAPLEFDAVPLVCGGEFIGFGFSAGSDCGPVPRVPSCAADLDGDGAPDLAIVGVSPKTNTLMISWQDGGKLTVPTPVLTKEKVAPDWIGCIRTAAGTGIAVLEGDAVRIVQCGGSAGRACSVGGIVAHGGASAGFTIGPAMSMTTGPGSSGTGAPGTGSLGSGVPNPITGLSAPPSVVAGDVTGDGIDDIVLTGFDQEIKIFAAGSTIP